MLFEQTLANHDFKYNFKGYTKEVTELPYSEDGNSIYYPNIAQKNFEKIPGAPIGYWVSDAWLSVFSNSNLKDITLSDGQTKTGDNAKFLRFLWEVSFKTIGVDNKWVKHPKGGGFRRWYGNLDTVINWSKDAREHYRKDKVARILPKYLWWKNGISWNLITSNTQSFRIYNADEIFNLAAPTLFFKDDSLIKYCLGLFNTPIAEYIIRLLNPTLNCNIGDIQAIPLIKKEEDTISNIVEQNISLSKQDWDAHETSWDFQRNELLSIDTSTYMENIDYKKEKHFEETGEHIDISPAAPKLGSLEWRMEQYKTKWERKFMQLHKNEEELNRQFIDIYGLQDELTPDVPLNEITILQQGEINVKEDGFTWNEDVMTKQLISYTVGCMLGRYRLDKPGLHIAHPNPTDEEIAPYEYNGEQWEIDDDGIMPLMPNDCGFSDNASARFADFIRVAMGNEEHVANLNYVEKCLGKTLEQYFVKDFWKDHKKMYQNRPIYWLFSSKKGAFQVIAYMHRMNPYTAERVRSKYLLPYIEHLEAEIDKLDARRAELSTKETKQLQALKKQLDECREYHERLQVVAEQAISFDLDDGVVVNYAKFGDILQKIK